MGQINLLVFKEGMNGAKEAHYDLLFPS